MLPASQVSGCSAFPAAQTSLDPVRTLVRALVRRPGDYEPMGCFCIYVLVCLFVCVFVCVSVCASVSLTSYASFYVSLFMFMCLLVCFHMSMCLSVSLWLCVWECICVCLLVSMYSSGSIPCADPQRERLTSPCVHASHPLGSVVPSWALPCSSSGPPHQTSPHYLLPCMCREKRGADLWRTVTTALSESFASPSIKALTRSPSTDAEIESRSNWEPDWSRLLANEWHRGG